MVASFTIPQITRYKEAAYKWDWISCSQYAGGWKYRDYDAYFESEDIARKNRKNSHRSANWQMQAIRALNADGIQCPTMKQINDKVREMKLKIVKED